MNEQRVMLRGLRPSTVALFEGAFGAIIGVAVSLIYLISGTIQFSSSTNSLVQGLLFGFSIGALSLLVLPAVYFAIGWVLGYIQGLIFNAVLRTSGGIELSVNQMEEMADESVAAEPATSYPYKKGEPAFGERIERTPREK